MEGACSAGAGLHGHNINGTGGTSSTTCNQSMIKLAPYTPEATAVFATAITLMILITIVGNILVIIAVLTSRSLRGPQNLFLVSLAAADILVATLIIPFSLANELMGYCLDRYMSISRAVTYGAQRTPKRIKCAILVVWLISAVISFPPLLSLNKNKGGGASGGLPQCELNNERWYILYSTIGSFFAPCLIMILVYMRIYQIAKQRTRCPPGEPRKEVPANAATPQHKVHTEGLQNGRGDETPSVLQKKPRPPTLAVSQVESVQEAASPPVGNKLLQPPSTALTPTTPCPSPSPSNSSEMAPHKPKEGKKAKKTQVKHPDNNNGESMSSDSDTEQGGRGLEVPCTPSVTPSGIHSPATIQKYRDMIATAKGAKLVTRRMKQEGTPNSARRKAMVNREKRFTFVLAVVIGVFVVCWFPFFFSYSLQAVCPEACALPEPLFKFFFWIGYCNSCLNPVIYTIFNKDFRRAFKKILCKNTKGTFF
ncbi:hypothetical protein Q8A67_010264 [Cirrhinus molitorella]|uniref:Alpha-2B adrenergic receptor n=1 Tax=Cirrhinus molitorella TaxID=172907 RepID=A0AA88TQA5_9TELE|nr:hypothetical protein Q8A67_010264 [Cirrhinus molitorella]